MKIDLSTIFIVIMVVIPGLFAQRSRDLIVPRSLRTKGASEELAELAALGMATHGVLILLCALGLVLVGALMRVGATHFFQVIDRGAPVGWAQFHLSEAALLCAGYIFLSFFASHCLGLVYGAFSIEGRLTARIFQKAKWLQRSFGITGLLGERPITYELLNSHVSESGSPRVLFLEAELKGGLGFYSGQLRKFAIVRDEEAHRPIYLIDPLFKARREDSYVRLAGEGVLIDLADVSTLLIRPMDAADLQTAGTI